LNIGEMIDRLIALKADRKELSHQDTILAREQSALEASILHAMFEVGTTRAESPSGSVSAKKKIVPAVTDWNEFYQWVAQHDAFDLLQRRLSGPAFRDRWDEGVAVPGTAQTELWDLSVHTTRN
jgi:hypothetical protein